MRNEATSFQRVALAEKDYYPRRLSTSGDEAEKQEEEGAGQSEDQDFAQELFPPDTVASRSNLLLAGSSLPHSSRNPPRSRGIKEADTRKSDTGRGGS